jgi:hypothetical protein
LACCRNVLTIVCKAVSDNCGVKSERCLSIATSTLDDEISE